MVRVLGIDPGTYSFDLVVLEDGHVIFEESIDTILIAEKPQVLLKAIEKAQPLDLIAAPSGYGVPVTFNEDIVDPWRFAVEVLLLTKPEDLEEGVKKRELGIMVYKALAYVTKSLWEKKLPACYIPGVIHLPTIPAFRKINRVDMGTADKLAVTTLAIDYFSRKYSIKYDEASFILVEMGFGYNAVIGVSKGKIVDGLGGTLVGPGFLTIGPIDAELAVMGRNWVRSDVFHGGVVELCKTFNINEAFEAYLKREGTCYLGFRAMLEWLIKAIIGMKAISVPEANTVILSGRLTTITAFVNEIEKMLPGFRIEKLGVLKGAKKSKHAAQGYAIVADGLAGGKYKELIKHMEIIKAKGTVLDYVVHPRLIKAKEELRRTYMETVRNPKL